MASVTLNVSDRHAAGVVVGAYPRANWLQSQLPPSGAPQGAATATGTVQADGSVTFTGLADSTAYFAARSTGADGYVQFSTPTPGPVFLPDATGHVAGEVLTLPAPDDESLADWEPAAAGRVDVWAGGVAGTAGNVTGAVSLDLALEEDTRYFFTATGDVVLTLTNPPTDGGRLTLLSDLNGHTLTVNGQLLGTSSDAAAFTKVEGDFDGTDWWWDVGGGGSGSGDTVVVKTADETVNNSATLQNDDHLVIPVLANGIYQFEALLYCSATTSTPDFKSGWTLPAGATMLWGAGTGLAANSPWTMQAFGSTPIVLATEAATVSWGSANGTTAAILRGKITVAGTAGNAQFQWAQDTATASDSKLLTGSHIRYRKIA